ncbi:MAG: molybdate ABC transporter substrate-binding protein [Pseudomonadota bacterium]
MPIASVNANTLFLIILILTSILLPAAGKSETLHLAVAANFTDVTRIVVPLFEKHTDHNVKVSFGSTGKLYAQIVHGAPFDIFLAADEARPRRLAEEGYAVKGSGFTYARGRLVLWSADKNLFNKGEAFLRDDSFRKLAIANPSTAPYGLAAQQVLQHLGIWEALSAKLVRGDSISQAFQFTATGNAELGLVAASQVKAWPQPGSQWVIPDDYYQPISQQAVLLKRGEQNAAAVAFISFLRSNEARTIIRDYGYAVE